MVFGGWIGANLQAWALLRAILSGIPGLLIEKARASPGWYWAEAAKQYFSKNGANRRAFQILKRVEKSGYFR